MSLEIAFWTGQSPIDPAQLGLRYAELEATRRDIAGAEEVAALIEARWLAAIADLAECQRLVPVSPDSTSIPASRIITGIHRPVSSAPGPPRVCRSRLSFFGVIVKTLAPTP